MPGKLGRTAKERTALLRNQASQLLWYGRIETTAAKAKELKSYVEKLITKAVNTYDDNIEFEVVKTDKKGKEVTVTNVKDGPKKLAARRAIMAKTYDLQEIKAFHEKKSDFKARTADVQHPLMDKLFNEIAPKYAQRKEELGQGGGYTRVYLLGARRGDGAETAIIELV
jgi:large subunit ribosomal protein L17